VHFPKTTWAVRSNLALASYLTEAGNHRRAIDYLKKVEEFPDDSHYPFALYQLAWAYFNIDDVPTASSYVKRHIEYFKEKRERSESKSLSASEQAYLEHSLKDVVTFYFDGFMKKVPGFTLGDALSTFRKVESGPFLGKMLVEFANLLRTRDQGEGIDKWQAQVIDEESDRPEALEVVMVHVDYLFVHQSYENMVSAAEGLKKLDQ
jgi:tetratricopeptide (TPR) repeat protein